MVDRYKEITFGFDNLYRGVKNISLCL